VSSTMAWWWIATSWEWRSRAQSPPQSACRTSCGTRSGDRTIRGSRSVPCQRSRTVARWPWSPSTGRSSPSHFVPVGTRNRGSSVNARESERLRDCESVWVKRHEPLQSPRPRSRLQFEARCSVYAHQCSSECEYHLESRRASPPRAKLESSSMHR